MIAPENTPAIETFPRRVGSTEAIIGVDLQMEAAVPVEDLPWVNSLRVSLAPAEDAQVDDDGQKSPSEGIEFDDELLTGPTEPGHAATALVGSISTSVTAEWFVYSAKPCADELAEAVAAQFPHLKVEARAQHDPGWSVFREFLMPSPIERHLIRNRRMLRELQERESKERDRIINTLATVNHTLWFSSSDDRNAFAESLPDPNFMLHYPDLDDPDEQEFQSPGRLAGAEDSEVEYGLTISREELIATETLDELVRRLFKRAASFGGEYEGWHVQIG
jgi:hypothetical protein